MHWLGFSWMIALSAVALVPVEADAASCLAGLDVVLPSGTVDAPPNTKIWIGDAYASEEIRLLDAEGNEVATTQTTLSRTDADGQVVVLTPAADLPAADYQVVTGPDDQVVTAFTVSGAPDTTPPEVPGGIARADPAPMCTLIETDANERTDEVIIARVEGGGSLDAATLSGDIHDIGTRGVFVIGDCGCESTWTDAEPGREFSIDFAAFDVAGNFSGWSDAEPAAIAEDDSGCGCNVRPRIPAAILGLPLLAFARRRRA